MISSLTVNTLCGIPNKHQHRIRTHLDVDDSLGITQELRPSLETLNKSISTATVWVFGPRSDAPVASLMGNSANVSGPCPPRTDPG